VSVALIAVLLAMSADTSPARPAVRGLRCFVLAPEVSLRKEDLADIKTAVRDATGRPVLRIENPDPSDRPPPRVLQVITLLRGNCDNGEGQRLWIRKGTRGWQVIKHLGGEGWGTAAAGASVTVQ